MVSSDEKWMAALGYWGSVLCWIPTLVIFLLKKDESVYIKKHTLQSMILGLASFLILGVALNILGIVTLGIGYLIIAPVQFLASLALLAYYVVLGIQVYQGQDPDMPVVTNLIKSKLGV